MLAQLTERRRRIEDGEASLGWKLGMGVPAAMAKLGTDAPLVGYLLAPARVDDGGTVSLDGWGNAKLEPEIAAHLAADLAPGTSREDAEAAIAGLGVAIELVDIDPDADDPEAILAADIFQRHVLLGQVTDRIRQPQTAVLGDSTPRGAQHGDAAPAVLPALHLREADGVAVRVRAPDGGGLLRRVRHQLALRPRGTEGAPELGWRAG